MSNTHKEDTELDVIFAEHIKEAGFTRLLSLSGNVDENSLKKSIEALINRETVKATTEAIYQEHMWLTNLLGEFKHLDNVEKMASQLSLRRKSLADNKKTLEQLQGEQ